MRIIFLFLLSLSLFIGCKQDDNFRIISSEQLPVAPEPKEKPKAIKGCMDKNAKNYNKKAEEEDGSCDFIGCEAEGYKETDPDYFKDYADPYLEKLENLGIKYTGKIVKDACFTIPGCMEKEADNFSSTANEENGSCEFKGCPIINTKLKDAYNNYKNSYPNAPITNTCDQVTGCMEKEAYNYNSNFLIPDKSCKFRGCPILDTDLDKAYKDYKAKYPNAADLEDTCDNYRGCLEPEAYNYDSSKKIADNTCRFKGCPITNTNLDIAYKNYISNFPTAAPLENTCDTLKGCLDPAAMNYEADKKIEDKSCVFKGCPELDDNIKIAYQNYKNLYPTAAPLVNTCESYKGCLNPNATNYDSTKLLPKGNCDFQWCSKEGYEFTDTNMTNIVNQYLADLSTKGISYIGTKEDQYKCGKKQGCTASKAKNYDSSAEKDIGTCSFKGCPTLDSELKSQYDSYKSFYPNSKLENTCPDERTEIFNQENAPHAGILWVVDNSGSMGDDQRNLANNFSSFVNTFSEKSLDFTMGITTTDSSHSSSSMYLLNRNKLDDNQSKFISDFQNLIKVGTRGSDYEKLFKGSDDFLKTHASELLKPNSFLIVIYLTDEREQSSQSVSYYLDKLRSYVDHSSKVKAFSISKKIKPSFFQSADYDSRIKEMSNETNGSLYNIQGSFGESLTDIGNNLVTLLNQFSLNTTPHTSTIKVKVNGNDSYDWSYDSSLNAIVFDTPPSYGSEITITYLPDEIP